MSAAACKRGVVHAKQLAWPPEHVPCCCDSSAQPGTGVLLLGQRAGEHFHLMQPVHDEQDTFALHSGRARLFRANG